MRSTYLCFATTTRIDQSVILKISEPAALRRRDVGTRWKELAG
jgi:hypothetical protein